MMQNYSLFLDLPFPFETSTTINSIISFELSQMLKEMQSQLQCQLMKNEHLKNRLPAEKPKPVKIQKIEKIEQPSFEDNHKQIVKVQKTLSKKKSFECKIETKNLPKNFGKAIITYIQNNPNQIGIYLNKFHIKYDDFVSSLLQRRFQLNTISNLRDLWIEEMFEYSQQMRELSLYFLRKHCFKYIFNSRVRNMHGHIKYRKRLLEALENPKQFTSIKTLSYNWPASKQKK